MFLYCLVCAMCAVGLQTHVLHDVWVYASLVTIINIALFYLHKCGELAPIVRGGLTRAFLAAERLDAQCPRYGETRRTSPDSSPAPVQANGAVASSLPIRESREHETQLRLEEPMASDKQLNQQR
jgi:hypothetical protein